MGRWYEIYHTMNQPFQSDDTKCTTAFYSDLQDDGGFNVYNSGWSDWDENRSGICGKAKCHEKDENGQCFVNFFFWQQYEEPNYLVVDTDYETHSIVYSCEEDGMAMLWLLAREPEVSPELEQKMMQKAKDALPNFDFNNLTKDYQGGKCKY